MLRFLQEKEYEPLGSVKPFKADVRIVVATNQDLSLKVEQGSFRRDLYYRLNVIKLKLPPLSSRREDIPLLVEHFIQRFNALMKKRIQSVSVDVMSALMRHSFPGNIRELGNALEHAAVLCPGSEIGIEHLPEDMIRHSSKTELEVSRTFPQDPLKTAEAQAISDVLSKNNGNRRKTAQALGISVVTLWRKMKSLGY